MAQAKTKKRRSEYGYVMVNLPQELKIQLQKEAKQQHRSLSNLCHMLILQALENQNA